MARTRTTIAPGYYGNDRKNFKLTSNDYVCIVHHKPDWCVERKPIGSICGRKLINNTVHILVWFNTERRVHTTLPSHVQFVCCQFNQVGTSSDNPILLDDE